MKVIASSLRPTGAGGYRPEAWENRRGGCDGVRLARRLLADTKLHGHKYAIDAVLAVITRRQRGQVTIFTSDVDDLERLVPDRIVVKKV